jgi:hypothetical protein
MGDHTEGTPLTGPADEPPKSGVFADWDGVQHEPDVVAEGNRLGAVIDPDDDEDNGVEEAPEHHIGSLGLSGEGNG